MPALSTIANLPPEAELILACARTTISDDAAACIEQLLARELDWDAVIAFARRHAVEALLYTALQRSFAELVPPDALASLRDHYFAGTQHTMALTAELLQLMKLFGAAGIAALPLKGPALAMLAYGNLSLRWSGDLDILVRSADVMAAKELLLARGYALEPPLNQRQEALHLQTHYEYTFLSESSGMCVELHYRFRPRYFGFALGGEDVWQQLGTVLVGGAQLPSLAPADLLLFLCAHATNHCWVRLAWICDIAELIRSHPQLDWALVQRRARALGSQRMLGLGLLLAHDLLGAPVPAVLLALARRDRAASKLATQVRARLFDDTIAEPEPGLLAGTIFRLRARERWRDRLRYGLRLATVTTAEDWDLLPLPASLVWVYSVIRPVRLLLTYGLGPLRRLRAPG